jgi:hypothetical protein
MIHPLFLAIILRTANSAIVDPKVCDLPSCAPLPGKYDVYGIAACTDPDPLEGLGPDYTRVSYVRTIDEQVARLWQLPEWCLCVSVKTRITS